MTDDATTWFDGPDERTEHRGAGGRRLLMLATVPWIAVGLLLVLLVIQRAGDPTGSEATPPPTETTSMAAEPDDAGEPDAPLTPGTADDDARAGDTASHALSQAPSPEPPDTQTARTAGDAVAVAIAVVRGWVSGPAVPGLELVGLEPGASGYLEHASVRRVELVAPDLAVATVAVVLLTGDEDGYEDARSGDVVVPLALDEVGVHPAGAPWWTPTGHELTVRSPDRRHLDDPATTERAITALDAAGYRDVEVLGVARIAADVLLAEVTARTEADDALAGEVWLREHGQNLEVLGLQPRPPAPDGATAPHDPTEIPPGTAPPDGGPATPPANTPPTHDPEGTP